MPLFSVFFKEDENMSKAVKSIIIAVIALVIIMLILSMSLNKKNQEKEINEDRFKIVTTTFSTYDFSKKIVGDKANVEFLLGPGIDSHSYEPSAADLIKIQEADIFIYIGGEMEKWVDKVIEANVLDLNNTKLIKVSDCVETIEEQEVDGAEEHEEEEKVEGAFDEHIWTSPTNAIKMVSYLAEEFGKYDETNKELYIQNANNYNKEIEKVRSDIQEVVDNKVRDRLVFGDKMPMQYFLNEFGLQCSAAFDGCSTETEPSAKTIVYLVNKVKEENIPVVLYIELSTGKTAKAIASETGAEAMQIQAVHNVSKVDFDAGESYVSLMKRNIDVLKKALQ